MAKVVENNEQDALLADLKTKWRWLSVTVIERTVGRLTIQFQDDRDPSAKFLFEWGEVPSTPFGTRTAQTST